MRYTNKSFSVGGANSDAYRENWDRIFGKSASNKPEVEAQIAAAQRGWLQEHASTVTMIGRALKPLHEIVRAQIEGLGLSEKKSE